MDELSPKIIEQINKITVPSRLDSALPPDRPHAGVRLQGVGPLIVTMPCGETIAFPSMYQLPHEDVPCSCGNPEHWFFKVS